ncbi:hypothetical protein D9619_008213 [Psilocybe cf. subviscida]|uniref:Uncharacterized protein n=1 Tax=Psilocybe cf. subviscida TaxID=2480587 RepID=A0A8H5ESY5_9AGAR|nr:hypothetical protein D9619_008213 [Psilocybe cf. subviscida]
MLSNPTACNRRLFASVDDEKPGIFISLNSSHAFSTSRWLYSSFASDLHGRGLPDIGADTRNQAVNLPLFAALCLESICVSGFGLFNSFKAHPQWWMHVCSSDTVSPCALRIMMRTPDPGEELQVPVIDEYGLSEILCRQLERPEVGTVSPLNRDGLTI